MLFMNLGNYVSSLKCSSYIYFLGRSVPLSPPGVTSDLHFSFAERHFYFPTPTVSAMSFWSGSKQTLSG